MNDSTAIARAEEPSGLEHSENRALALPIEMSVEVFEAQVKREEAMRGVLKDYVGRNMKEGHHFSNTLGTVTLPKPMLLQEGTRNICSLFKLTFGNPEIDEKWLDGDHYRVRTHIALFNAEGRQIASGDGICSTRETKYAYRTGQRECPECHVPAIMKDNKTANGGFYCWAKKDGCGAKFAADDARITEQVTGRVDNPDKADIENTVLKMSIKRAKSAAVCDVPMVSEIFAPDEEGARERGREGETQRSANSKPANAPRSNTQASAAVGDEQPPQGGTPHSIKTAVDLAAKLQKDHGVDFESLAMQFLPEGVGKFSELSEDQAAEVVPGLAELLTAKVSGK